MTKHFRTQLVLATVVAVSCAVGFAQSGGEAVYKAKCQSCHGTSGTPNPGIAKMMGVKPATDPSIKALSIDQMVAAIKSGKGKMKPVAGLSDSQIKDSATYYKSLTK